MSPLTLAQPALPALAPAVIERYAGPYAWLSNGSPSPVQLGRCTCELALLAGKKAANRRPTSIIRAGFGLVAIGVAVVIVLVPRIDSGWYLAVPLLIAGAGLGLLVSQLNNYTLSPVTEERVSEAAGVNSAGGSFGLSFGLAFAGAIMLATLSVALTKLADASTVLSPAERQQVSKALEHDAEIMSNTALEAQLRDQPPATREEIVRINTPARHRARQVALAIPSSPRSLA